MYLLEAAVAATMVKQPTGRVNMDRILVSRLDNRGRRLCFIFVGLEEVEARMGLVLRPKVEVAGSALISDGAC